MDSHKFYRRILKSNLSISYDLDQNLKSVEVIESMKYKKIEDLLLTKLLGIGTMVHQFEIHHIFIEFIF